MEKIRKMFYLLIFISTIFLTGLTFGQSGNISGKIIDSETGKPLPYSNVLLLKTGFGASAKVDGTYIIRNIPEGKYTIRVSYLGYKKVEKTVEVLGNKTIEVNFHMIPESLQGKEVVVTAQAVGQQHAINEQLNSLSVKNVVSSARIQQLPDANAAESVSRLPGISLIRTGGEGSQVVIRGLSPQYNQITIDGVQLPGNVSDATNVNSGADDRATDLSMISSNMLGSIEVIKAITPDMDAAVLGGVVNFGLRKAARGATAPSFEIISQGSYNKLKNSYNNYKVVGSAEKRFLGQNLGVFVQGSIEKKDLSANELNVNYLLADKSRGDTALPLLNTMTLTDVLRTRNRYGGTITMDYEHSTGEIDFMNFLSISDTKVHNRGESYPSDNGYITYDAGNSPYNLTTFTNLLSIKQKISIFNADIKLSHSYSERRAPGSTNFEFLQPNAVNPGDVPELRKLPPQQLATYVKHNPAAGYLQSITFSNSLSEDREYTGSLDMQTNLVLSDFITGKFKFGGMYQYSNRSYNYAYWFGSMFDDGQTVVLAMANQLHLKTVPLGSGGPLKTLSYEDFIDNGYNYHDFFGGLYNIGQPANVDLILQASNVARAHAGTNPAQVGFKYQEATSKSAEYSGNEVRDAAYGMFVMNFGSNITFIPGVRYQNLTTDYKGIRGQALIAGKLQYTNSIEKLSHGYYLPMAHLIYRPLPWLQLHFAYTNTLNYPAYSEIIPSYLIGESSITYNNYRLKPATSENYDLALSVFNNAVGLFTIDGFKKNIKNLIFSTGATYPTTQQVAKEYPEFPTQYLAGREFDTYINNPYVINLYGVEVDWQTHFWYLPGPLSGFVLDANYTHIFSDAHYPRTERVSLGYDPYTGTEQYTYIDTFYTARLLNQPKDIFNISAGYDYKGFSSRLSIYYQDNVFKQPSFWLQERIHSGQYLRFDLSVRQKLPWHGIQVYFNLNNITGEDDISLNEKTAFPATRQKYGMSGDLGVRIDL